MLESYILERWKSGGSQFEASLGKKSIGPHLTNKKVGMVVHDCQPNYVGRVNRRIPFMPAWA
jgi:hypothetical protein